MVEKPLSKLNAFGPLILLYIDRTSPLTDPSDETLFNYVIMLMLIDHFGWAFSLALPWEVIISIKYVHAS